MHLITMRDYNILANEVHKVDPKLENKYRTNKLFKPHYISQTYKILDISRDGTYGPHHKYGAKNGMQAMTVAPVNKKGKVDYCHITIADAGTNTADKADVRTDLENIVAPLPVYVGKI